MNWDRYFSKVTAEMRRNTVREFLKYAATPGMISFGGGLPAAELFPVQTFLEATETVLKKFPGKALQYGESEGVLPLREYIANENGVAVENVAITSGAQQALDLLGRILIDPGDRIAVENPTYLALLSAWRVHGPQFVPVPTLGADANPMTVLNGAKMFYVVPNFQNPQGTTLSEARRIELAEFARQHEMLVVEDDPYGELRYEGSALPSLFALAGRCEGPVIKVGTVSKVLSPGLRVGWVVAHDSLVQKLVRAKQAADLHTSTMNQYVTLEMLRGGLLATHLPKLRLAYQARRDAMLKGLEEFMPNGVNWSRPAGGMFLLVTLPPKISGAMIAQRALTENVRVVPGDDFHLSAGLNTLRLNFSNCTPEMIRQGVEKLAAIVRCALDEPGKYQVSFSSD